MIPRYKIVEWDWKDEPDWEKINDLLAPWSVRPFFYQVDTESDSYAVLISDTPLTRREVQYYYKNKAQ